MKTEIEIKTILDQLVHNMANDLGAEMKLPVILQVLQDVFSQKLYGQVEAYVSSMHISELLCLMAALEKRIDLGMQRKATVKVSNKSQLKN